MAYADYSLEALTSQLGITVSSAELFGNPAPVPPPPWLAETLQRGLRQVLVSEKARSEFIVVPILLACQELSPRELTIFSGQRLDVDPARGLIGECDYILAATPPVPALQSPLLTVVEAKRNEVESGVWQCLAQMVGARDFNLRAGTAPPSIFGCVTNGEAWQFLRLTGSTAELDRRRYYIDNPAVLLGAFRTAVAGVPTKP